MSDFELTFSSGPDYEENDCWVDEFGVVYSKDKKILKSCRNYELTEYHIPEGTETIGSEAFIFSRIKNVYLPESLVIPDSVKSIEANVLSECKSLKFIELSSDLKHIKNGFLEGVDRLEYIIMTDEQEQFFEEYIIVKNKKILKRFDSFIKPDKNLYRKKKDKDW